MMTLLYDRHRGRICCRWKEPVTMRFQGKDITIERQKTGSVRVSDLGTLSKRDLNSIKGSDRAVAISMFHKALLRDGVFTRDYVPSVCHVCGTSHDVRACFDSESQQLTWLCRVHDKRLGMLKVS
ncbi:hypothetical protein [Desulfobaculum bizertense]|nr:hypothetical protein [Desulfobaculum bizertense]UIJ36790.1 hypothetical protein LWC08_08555 [Desulfobaculum bizertense]